MPSADGSLNDASRPRSPVTSRSNWANDKSKLSVSRPIDAVVLTMPKMLVGKHNVPLGADS
jgi:hypothetical protein